MKTKRTIVARTKTAHERECAILTPTAVREQFDRAGISIAGWARAHGVHPSTVRNVLNGRKAVRGDTHRVAVLLGLKAGRIDVRPEDLVAPQAAAQ